MFNTSFRARCLTLYTGKVGIEPTNSGVKVRCLTTWRLPTTNYLKLFLVTKLRFGTDGDRTRNFRLDRAVL